MTIPKTDYLKVFVLISLFAICFYSALQKFVFTPPLSRFEGLQPNFSICDKYGDVKEKADKNLSSECEKVVRLAYGNADMVCEGYIKNWGTCMQQSQSRRQSKCQTEFSNIEGCANAIVKSAVNKWKASS